MHPLPTSISLHIGAHKTASSHLQKVLYQNRPLMLENNVRLYGPRYLRMRGRSLAAMFNTSWSENPAPHRRPMLQLRFLGKKQTHLIFTEENFVGQSADYKGRTAMPIYPFAAERVQELVTKWSPIETDLFLAVRDPTSFLASLYSQAMLGGVHIRPRQFRRRNDWREVDWLDYVTRLRAVKGLGQIYVWRQEDYHECQSQIVQKLARWKTDLGIETLETRVHQGLSVTAVQKTLEGASEGHEGRLAHDARREYPVGENHSLFNLYSESAKRKSGEKYADHMGKIEQMAGVTILRPAHDVHEG